MAAVYAVFQTTPASVILQLKTTQPTSSSASYSPLFFTPLPSPFHSRNRLVQRGRCIGQMVNLPYLRASHAPAFVDPKEHLERCFDAFSAKGRPVDAFCNAPVTMKGQYGSVGSVTLEKSKLDLSSKTTRSSPEVSFFCSFLFHVN